MIVIDYDPQLGSRDFKTVSALLEYSHPLSGQIYHLVIHQAIQIPNLDHHLLCPMQCRVNEIAINDVPKFLMKTPTPDSHSIVAHDIKKTLTPLVLPLYIHGVTAWLPVSKPYLKYWNYMKYQNIELTAEQLDWEPNDTRFQEYEEAMTSYGDQLMGKDENDNTLIISSMNSLTMPSATITGDSNFGTILDSKICVSAVNMSIDQSSKLEASMTDRQPEKKILTSQRKMVDAPTLAKRWIIPIDSAKNTIFVTTQRGVRHVENPSIMRRFLTNDHMLRYNRLPHPMFTDILLAGTASQRDHKFAQVLATYYGWSCTIPMTKKSDGPFALDHLFRHEGVPPEMIMDGSKEQNLGDFACV